MSAGPGTFGELLLRLRKAAGLTQEALAERAGLSARAISDLERGVKHTPRKDTLLLLADALALAPPERAALAAAARGPLAAPVAAPDSPAVGAPTPGAEAPAAAPRHNLPAPVTPLLGREGELAALTALLTDPAARLVTCTGTGGTGKTRLALQAAADVLDAFPDGVYFVDLVPLREPALVPAAIAAALGLQESGERPLLAQVQDALRARRLLLVLDNYEHLLAAAPVVAALLAAAPRLKVLVTSRAILRLYGEHEFPVPPLPLDDIFPDGVHFVDLAGRLTAEQVAQALVVALGVREAGGQPLAEQLAQHLRDKRLLLVVENLPPEAPGAALLGALGAGAPGVAILGQSAAGLQVYQAGAEGLAANAAVSLFVDRARAAQPAFAATPAHLLAAAAIAARLDGLPLAIELAAARSRQFAPGALLRRLDARLALLTGGGRDQPARHQTLRALIDWSYHLLEPAAREVFAGLAVFAGGCMVAAAEAVCSSATVPAAAVGEHLAELAEQSLLRCVEGRAGEPRYVLLETIHEYAGERLAAGGEEARLREGHFGYFLALAEAVDGRIRPAYGTPAPELAEEIANLRVALAWAREQDLPRALRLGGLLGTYWWQANQHTEGHMQLQALLDRASAAPAAVRESASYARVLGALGIMAGEQGDLAAGRAALEASLQLYRRLPPERFLGLVLNRLGWNVARQPDWPQSAPLFEESLAVCRAFDDRPGEVFVLQTLAHVVVALGEPGRGLALAQESLILCRPLGDPVMTAVVLLDLGVVESERGDLVGARAHLEESLALLRVLGKKYYTSIVLAQLGDVAMEMGDWSRAREVYREGVILSRELRLKEYLYLTLRGMSFLAAAQGAEARAARIFGAAEALRLAMGVDWPWSALEAAQQAARARLGPAAWAAAQAEGEALTLDAALDYALEED